MVSSRTTAPTSRARLSTRSSRRLRFTKSRNRSQWGDRQTTLLPSMSMNATEVRLSEANQNPPRECVYAPIQAHSSDLKQSPHPFFSRKSVPLDEQRCKPARHQMPHNSIRAGRHRTIATSKLPSYVISTEANEDKRSFFSSTQFSLVFFVLFCFIISSAIRLDGTGARFNTRANCLNSWALPIFFFPQRLAQFADSHTFLLLMCLVAFGYTAQSCSGAALIRSRFVWLLSFAWCCRVGHSFVLRKLRNQHTGQHLAPIGGVARLESSRRTVQE